MFFFFRLVFLRGGSCFGYYFLFFIVLGVYYRKRREYREGEGYQCWEFQGGGVLGEVFFVFFFGEKRLREQRRVLRVLFVKILGVCKKGQMAFYFLERCLLLICFGLCMQGIRVGVVERVRIYVVWWERCEGFLWVKEIIQKVVIILVNRVVRGFQQEILLGLFFVVVWRGGCCGVGIFFFIGSCVYGVFIIFFQGNFVWSFYRGVSI